MFHRRPIAALLFILATFYLHGQQLQNDLNIWTEINPVEKVYVHTDRESYYCGQDIWFKAYFMTDLLPSHLSSSIYIELLDAKGNKIDKKVFPVFLGVAQGQLTLSNDLPTGNYTFLAYSLTMLNQNDFLFTKQLRIYGTENKKVKSISLAKLQLNFFPEGGSLITGLQNRIAFKANDENGFPADILVEVKTETGETLVSAKTLHDGMGLFLMIPQPGRKYYAVAGGKSYPMPEATTSGLSLQAYNKGSSIQFKLQYIGNSETFQPAYMVGQMLNRSVFRQDFKNEKELLTGVVQTNTLPTGILQLTIFNAGGMPLAERLFFVNNKEYILPARFSTDMLNTGEREMNQFYLHPGDSVNGSFSVSVMDADFEDTLPRPQNIYSSFLLTSDIKGYVHNPSWYFTTRDESVEQALDLVMMTNGWRRFKWSDVSANTLPQPVFRDNGFIKLSGKATMRDRNKPFANQDLLLMISAKDSVMKRRKYSEIIQTDAQGNFTVDSLLFYGQSKLLFSDIKGGKSKFLTIKLNGDFLRSHYPVPTQATFMHRIEHSGDQAMQSAYKEYLDGIGTMLENVTVTGRKKTSIEQLDESYTSGLFARGIMARTIDLTDEPPGAMNIFDYLSGRVPGISVEKQNYYHIFYRKPKTMQVVKPIGGDSSPPNAFGGNAPNEMSLFLDETPVEADLLASVPLMDIAFVKIFPTFSGAPGGGPDGTLAVYLKKGKDRYNDVETASDVIFYEGYSIIKEFYSQDYSIPQSDDNKKDNRITLLWQPDIYVNASNTKIPIQFYNNDRTKAFKIVVEGITGDGRLLMFEKIIK